MNWPLFQNSLVLSLGVTALAGAFGLASALFVAGAGSVWRTLLLIMGGIVLVLPPFLVTNSWQGLLGHTGVLKRWVPLNLYSMGGCIWVLSLVLWPLTMFLVLGAWQRLGPELMEAVPELRGVSLLRWLLLPAAGSTGGLALALTFVLAFNNFAVPALLQVKVFPTELWVRFNTNFDYGGALLISLPMLLLPLLALGWPRRRAIAWPRLDTRVPSSVFRRQLGARWYSLTGVFVVAILLLSLALPISQLLASGRTWTSLPAVLATSGGPLFNSFLFASSAAAVGVAAGLAGGRLRWGAFLWLPLFVPGVFLGIVLVYALNRAGLDWFYQSAGIVILALALRYLAVGWHGAAHARRAMDPDLLDAARLAGVRGWSWVWNVVLPQTWWMLAAAWYLTYLICLWDVETLIMILPPGGETLALRAFNLLHDGHHAHVNALCLLLLGLAVGPVLLGAAFLGACRRFRVRARTALSSSAIALGTLMTGTGCSDSAPDRVSLESRLFSHVVVIGSRGTGPGRFNKPRSVTVDRNDNLYVADFTGRIQKFAPDGEFLLSWQMPETDNGRPKGMGIDGEGRVIVVEPHYARVNHFTTGGERVHFWGEQGTNVGQIRFPRAVAVNPRGELFISEYGVRDRIQRFAANGERVLDCFGRFGSEAGELNRAEGLGLDGQGRLYVADSCNHRIQVFSENGRFLKQYGRPGDAPGQMSYPYDVRVDAIGYQFVCEFGNSRIQVFDADHEVVEIIGGIGSAPGRFSNPWSIALDSTGNLYVADAINHRVQKLVRRKPISAGTRATRVSSASGGAPRSQ